MKIICIGRNYADHAAELKNAVPTEPLIFMKPPSALLVNEKPLYYPSFTKNLHYELEVVLKIVKNGRHIQNEFAKDYFEEIGLGIDFTARDIQEQLKKKGHPWEKAKGFDNSAAIGSFVSKSDFDMGNLNFHFERNGVTVQKGNSADLIFNFDFLISYISQFFKLQIGDLIYTGTPAGVGPVEIGDVLEGYLEGNKLIHCDIK